MVGRGDRQARPVTIPGAWIETLADPKRYTIAQIEQAAQVAHMLYRGRFVLCEPPRR